MSAAVLRQVNSTRVFTCEEKTPLYLCMLGCEVALKLIQQIINKIRDLNKDYVIRYRDDYYVSFNT